MTSSSPWPDPFDLVARVLRCPRDSLSIESAMYRDYGWDSFGQVDVILALEEAYGIRIRNDQVMALTTMRGIVDFSKRAREASQSAKEN